VLLYDKSKVVDEKGKPKVTGKVEVDIIVAELMLDREGN
jgi:hypothetical protein